MSLPHENLRSLKQTHQKMRDLLAIPNKSFFAKMTPEEFKKWRNDIYYAIKHYPFDYDLDRLYADKVCLKCHGIGFVRYDENHGTVCDACCKHEKGWWELTPGFAGYIEGADNGCCMAGCGTMRRDLGAVSHVK